MLNLLEYTVQFQHVHGRCQTRELDPSHVLHDESVEGRILTVYFIATRGSQTYSTLQGLSKGISKSFCKFFTTYYRLAKSVTYDIEVLTVDVDALSWLTFELKFENQGI